MALSFIQTIFFIYLLLIRACTTFLLRHEKECLALFEFKQSISHQPYASTVDVGGMVQKLDSWRKITSNASDHDSDCCLWDGVVCSYKGHVIGLDLSQSSLHGSIKSNNSLFKLVHLEMLNLSMNDFVESHIPPEIAHLKQLRSLDLSYSSFSGQIPIEISHLLQLTVLDLSWNPLKLQSPSLEYLLQNLTSLERLHLSGVDISSSLPSFLSNFSSLRSIDLENCGLRNEFPSKIFHLPMLKYVSMYQNPILTGSIPEIQNNTLLMHLNLAATSFAGSLPESIGNLNFLVFFAIYGSYVSGCIPRSLSNMTRLTYLDLGQDYSRMGVEPLFPRRLLNQPSLEVCDKDWIRKLTNIERLFLAHINMHDHDEILPSFANLTKLSKVSMINCFLSSHIPSSFMNLTQLRVIDLSENQLEGKIPTSVSNLKSLEILYLNDNNFSGRLDMGTFVGLTKLKRLSLDDNRISLVSTNNHTGHGALVPQLEFLGLSSCNLNEFPSFLRLQKKLSLLQLARNKIKGLVPEWFLNNTRDKLLSLDLSFNSITGFHQHPNFLPWVRLEYFNIMYNKLQGQLPIPPPTMNFYSVSNNNLTEEIPQLICEVKSLQVLDLSSNNMTGSLPPCLGNLSDSLSHLDLKENNFNGPMMNAFTNGTAIEYLDLSENQFTGQVARTLANCTNLKVLVLGGNSLDDSFPDWLGALSKLQVLILRSNKFYGAIQDLTTVGSHFLKLRILDLSNNGFRGQLPKRFFQTLKSMKGVDDSKSDDMVESHAINSGGYFRIPYSLILTNKGAKREYQDRILNIYIAIDLSCNNFEGQIPPSLSDLHGLQALNLSNNHFTGHILQSFRYLQNLESLDLSRNELSGEIPQELTQLGFLEVFNLSFNRLHGKIPQGKQFSTFDETSYIGNPDLCGELLSKKCQSTKASTSNEPETLLPSDHKIDLIVISLGAVSGLVIGIIGGNFLYARYEDWFNERFKLRKERWVRPLSNTSRN